MALWLELYERYISNETQLEELENLGIPTGKHIEYKYRRISRKLEDIEQISEIEGNKDECVIRFYSGESIVVKDSFDDICIMFNDFCNGTLEFPDNADNN